MNIVDLPDEILLLILNKLNIVESLSKQIGIHHPFDRLLFDDIYVRQLNFTIKSWNNSIISIEDSIIDHACQDILPLINEKIIKLQIEPNSFERILRAADYPKLSRLSLTNFQLKQIHQHLTSKIKNMNREFILFSFFVEENTGGIIELLTNQIKYLNIEAVDRNDDEHELNLFESIVSYCKCLIELKYVRLTGWKVEIGLIDQMYSLRVRVLRVDLKFVQLN